MALAAFRSKAMSLLLFIHFYCCSHVVCVCVCLVLFVIIQHLVSFLDLIHLAQEEKVGYLILTHINLASLLWDIGIWCKARSAAAKHGV